MTHSRAKSIGSLFALELDDVDGGNATSARDVLRELLEDWSPPASDQQQVAQAAQQAHVLALTSDGEVSLERFALLLAVRGHHVWLRTGRLDCCSGQVALRHTFVVAGAAGCTEDPVPQLFVVDPCFKEQFQLPNATPEYTALWQELPSLFVGTAEQLVPIVELMCTQMQQAFADSATSCPPWRTPSCMLSKWLPSAAEDVQVFAPGSGDSDSISSRPSSSSSTASHSALSSPAQPFPSAATGHGLLARICTVAGASGEAAAEGGNMRLTPRSARSPLYFDQHEQLASRRGLFGRVSSDDLIDTAVQPGTSPTAPQHTLLVQWGVDDGLGIDLPAGGRVVSDTSCFLASGSWGLGGIASTSSSPGCDMPWGALRSVRSEDCSGRASAAAGAGAAHGVAIVQRAPSRSNHHTKDSDGGFAQALAGRAGFGQLMAGSPVGGVVSRGGGISSSMQQVGLRACSSSYGGYRGRLGAANPTLDISRFDRGSLEDVPPAWDTWGSTSSIGSSRKMGSGSSSANTKPSVSAGPPVRRRVSSTSSQCSALSAAIAGKGVATTR